MNPVQGVFRALSDPTRREILTMLATEDLTIAQVADRFDISRGAIKKHLSILEEGALISVRAKGREKLNHIQPEALEHVNEWLHYFSRFWDNKLEQLQHAVSQHQKT